MVEGSRIDQALEQLRTPVSTNTEGPMPYGFGMFGLGYDFATYTLGLRNFEGYVFALSFFIRLNENKTVRLQESEYDTTDLQDLLGVMRKYKLLTVNSVKTKLEDSDSNVSSIQIANSMGTDLANDLYRGNRVDLSELSRRSTDCRLDSIYLEKHRAEINEFSNAIVHQIRSASILENPTAEGHD